MKTLKAQLIGDFANKEYAHSRMQSNSVNRISAQIYALRKQRSLSQNDLAELTGFTQERISKMESGHFDSLTMKTLNKLAAAFDVNLSIEFNSVSNGIKDIVNLSSASLNVVSRSDTLVHLTALESKTLRANAPSELLTA